MDVDPRDPRAEVLQQFCALVPDADRARLSAMDPTDYLTFVEAYLVARRLATPLPLELRRRIVRIIFDFHDARAVPRR